MAALAHFFFMYAFPPMILCAGFPRIIVGRANWIPQLGHSHGTTVKSSTMRSTKHLTSDPLPPLAYRYSRSSHLAQWMETFRSGKRAFGCAIISVRSAVLVAGRGALAAGRSACVATAATASMRPRIT